MEFSKAHAQGCFYMLYSINLKTRYIIWYKTYYIPYGITFILFLGRYYIAFFLAVYRFYDV